MKFDIKYMIGQKEKDSLKKIKHFSQFNRDVSPDGWIQITIGDYEYGCLQDDSSIDGFEILENWFCTFILNCSQIQELYLIIGMSQMNFLFLKEKIILSSLNIMKKYFL